MSPGVYDIQRGVYSMYVYCDVCKENVVGDPSILLQQIVPKRRDHEDYVRERYETPIYVHSSAAKQHIGYKNRHNR